MSGPSTSSRHRGDGHDVPPAFPIILTRGINITGWFRFPVSRDPAALAAYLSDQALADIRTAGFDFVRLAVDPAIAETQRATLIAAIRRIQRQDLTVVISPHPQNWHLETDPVDRDRLQAFWRTLAPALRTLDPARTVPEVLNEPVFPHDPAGWAALQHQILTIIRQALPSDTVVLTGQDGFSSDLARAFTATPGAYTFGVCAPGGTAPICSVDPTTVPKAMDVITPPGVSQATELNPTLGPVVIQPVTVP